MFFPIPDLFLIAFVLFAFGTVIGSFLNVVIYRVPKKEDIVKSRSHCMTCNHTLAWYDLFPVLSWFSLGGKCRYCKTKISGRYALVETLCGLSFAAAFLCTYMNHRPESVLFFNEALFNQLMIYTALALALFPVLICLSFYDIDSGEIEYWCPITIAGLGLIALALSLTGVTETAWASHLIGAVIISVPFAILAFFGAMGGADVQLMAAAGLLLGWNIIPAALIGIFLGAIVGIIQKATHKTDPQTIYDDDNSNSDGDGDESELPAPKPAPKGTVIRFGPYLAIGIAVGFLYGDTMIEWYLGLMRG